MGWGSAVLVGYLVLAKAGSDGVDTFFNPRFHGPMIRVVDIQCPPECGEVIATVFLEIPARFQVETCNFLAHHVGEGFSVEGLAGAVSQAKAVPERLLGSKATLDAIQHGENAKPHVFIARQAVMAGPGRHQFRPAPAFVFAIAL